MLSLAANVMACQLGQIYDGVAPAYLHEVGHLEMLKTNPNWKRRLIILTLLLLVIGVAFVNLLFRRFHFTSQSVWPLSELQWNHQGVIHYDGPRPQIIGHRGSVIPSLDGATLIGNTENAIKAGIDAGVDWIEIDVRYSAGPNPVLLAFHDKRIDQKTNGEGAVSELDLTTLKKFWIKVDPSERILTLDEVFQTFHQDHQKWILDVKVTRINQQVVSWIDEQVENGKLTREQVIIFGTFDVLKDYKDSGYLLGLTALWSDVDNRLKVLFQQTAIIEQCRDLNCDYLVLPAIFASRSLVGAAKSNGINVWVYGVNDIRDSNFLASVGVTGFIVDDPKKFSD